MGSIHEHNPGVQRIHRRPQKKISATSLVDYLRDNDMTNVEFSRMFGLGESTPAGWIANGVMPTWVGKIVELLNSQAKSDAVLTILTIPIENYDIIKDIVEKFNGTITKVKI